MVSLVMSQISFHKSAIVNCNPHLGFCWIKGYCKSVSVSCGSRRWSFASTDPRRLNKVFRLIRIHIMALHSPSRRSWEPVLLDQAGKSAVVDGCPKSCPIEMPWLLDFPAMYDDTGGSTSFHVGHPQSVMGILHWWDPMVMIPIDLYNLWLVVSKCLCSSLDFDMMIPNEYIMSI